jgi:hypothetical protein
MATIFWDYNLSEFSLSNICHVSGVCISSSTCDRRLPLNGQTLFILDHPDEGLRARSFERLVISISSCESYDVRAVYVVRWI